MDEKTEEVVKLQIMTGKGSLKGGASAKKGNKLPMGNLSSQKKTKAARKGSVKPPADQASPISSLTASMVDYSSIGGYEECVEALKHAEDDTNRAALMGQVIGHLKNQLQKMKVQLDEVKKEMAQNKNDLESQLQKEKNLRQQAQEEKAALRFDLIQKIEERDRMVAELEAQLGPTQMMGPKHRACRSPDFMHYRPEAQEKAHFDKRLLLDFVKHHKNMKEAVDESELKV